MPDNERMTVRESIEKAASDLGGSSDVEADISTDTSAAEPAEAADTSDVSVDAVVDTAPDTETPKADRARDPETGKFVEKPKETPSKAPKAAAVAQADAKGKAGAVAPVTAAPVKPPEAANPDIKAPASWSPAAKALFEQAPKELREVINQREQDMARYVAKNGEALKAAQAFQEVVRPYEAIARANGGTVPFVQQLLTTADTLMRGSEHQKTQLVAQIIQGYGIDPGKLADALNSAPQQQQPQGISPAMVEQLVAQQFQSMAQQRIRAKAAADIEAFQANPPEFWNDPEVRAKAAGLLDGHVASNLQEAYDAACGLVPHVKQALDQRKASEAAKAAQAAALKAKNAASSVRSSTAITPNGATRPGSMREAIEAAQKKLGGRV